MKKPFKQNNHVINIKKHIRKINRRMDNMVIDRPFIVKENKGKEFLEAFSNLPRVSDSYIKECERINQKSLEVEKLWKNKHK